MNIDDSYDEIRSAVRALCAQFPDEYFRKIDLERGYPEESVRSPTVAGGRAASIPPAYGGAGPPVDTGLSVTTKHNHPRCDVRVHL